MTVIGVAIPASEARKNFYQLLQEVGGNMRQFTITLRGRAQAVLMSNEEFDSWLETLEVASDKKLVHSLRKGRKSGRIFSQKQANKLIGW